MRVCFYPLWPAPERFNSVDFNELLDDPFTSVFFVVVFSGTPTPQLKDVLGWPSKCLTVTLLFYISVLPLYIFQLIF